MAAASARFTRGVSHTPDDTRASGAREVIGPARETTLGDLHNVQIEFAVIEGDGALTAFISSVNNGTGDTILRAQ